MKGINVFENGYLNHQKKKNRVHSLTIVGITS